MKRKAYQMVVRPAVMYSRNMVVQTKRKEAELEVAKLKMLRFSVGVTGMDKVRF